MPSSSSSATRVPSQIPCTSPSLPQYPGPFRLNNAIDHVRVRHVLSPQTTLHHHFTVSHSLLASTATLLPLEEKMALALPLGSLQANDPHAAALPRKPPTHRASTSANSVFALLNWLLSTSFVPDFVHGKSLRKHSIRGTIGWRCRSALVEKSRLDWLSGLHRYARGLPPAGFGVRWRVIASVLPNWCAVILLLPSCVRCRMACLHYCSRHTVG